MHSSAARSLLALIPGQLQGISSTSSLENKEHIFLAPVPQHPAPHPGHGMAKQRVKLSGMDSIITCTLPRDI